MAKITFLGTTCMQPTVSRNHSGILLTYLGEQMLFDCGEGTQRQLKIVGVAPTKVKRIFISHWHGDHVLGLPGLLSTMGANQCPHTVEIYGPVGSLKLFSHLKKAFPSINMLSCQVIEVARSGVIFRGKGYSVEARKLKHSTPCVGFAFVEDDKYKVVKSLLRKSGLKAGPEVGKLVAGSVIKVKGKTVRRSDVCKLSKGRKFAYVADTRPCSGALALARGADLLVVESTFHSDEIDAAKKFYHMTALESGQLALDAGVSRVVLTHPSLRYKDVSVLVKEAKKEFKKVIFAEDFMEVEF